MSSLPRLVDEEQGASLNVCQGAQNGRLRHGDEGGPCPATYSASKQLGAISDLLGEDFGNHGLNDSCDDSR